TPRYGTRRGEADSGAAIAVVTRHPTPASTTAAHDRYTVRAHGAPASVPELNPCTIATGQHAYALQCTARQTRYPMRRRSKLVITRAASRSTATTPSPIPSGRYRPVNGTTAFSR